MIANGISEKIDLDTKISDYIDTSAYFINASEAIRQRHLCKVKKTD